MKYARIAVTALILSSSFSFLTISPVSAHSPRFPSGNHEIASAYQINNPAKSWAIYTSLRDAHTADYYKLDVSKGDRIEISLTVPKNPGRSGFIPSFALLAPRPYESSGFMPGYVEVPLGYYAAPMNGKIPTGATYEPFTPGWFYGVADQTYTATESGRYFIVVYGNPGMTGNYGLATGYIETFTVADWLTIPYNVHRVFVWEGQGRIKGYLPMALILLLGGSCIWFTGRRKPPKSLSKWLAVFSGLAFFGSAANMVLQMIFAISITGSSTEALITLIFVAVAMILGVLTLIYALQEKRVLSRGRRAGLIVIAALGVAGWAGFYIGPSLAVLAAAVPANKVANS